MPLPKEACCTLEDIYRLPDGQRAELIDGQIFMMTPPSRIHQRLVSQLTKVVGQHIDSKGGSCQVYPAPFAVVLTQDEDTYVEPDLCVVCDPEKLSDRGCEGAPDLVIEIVSPSSRQMDYIRKTSLYAESGVREYWIVDPSKRRTTVYQYEKDAAPFLSSFDQPLTVGIWGDLKIVLSDLVE